MLNIVIPMAGLGSRFAQAGYADPKPLIPVHGIPMIRLVTGNLRPARAHRFVFICQRTVSERYALRDRLTAWAPGSVVVEIDGLTDGAACTVLAAADLIGDGPLMIANSDQYVAVDIDRYLADMDARGLDGLIMTMETRDDPKWSYAAVDAHGRVTHVVEKQPISHHATVGIYNFARGGDFVEGARRMIARDERSNNEFYVAPVYNQLIADGADIGVHSVGPEAAGMYGLGIPADLDRFLDLDLSREAVARAVAVTQPA